MPVRFTCRLMVVRTPTGKLRVQYGYLGDECLRSLTVTGPRMVNPPTEEMTDEEFERWESELCESGTGFSQSFASESVDAPLVEARRTYEDVIPPGSVVVELHWAVNAAEDRSLALKVTNRWNRPIPRITVTVVFENEAHQPGSAGGIRIEEIGGSATFTGPKMGDDLWPGVTIGCYLDPVFMRGLRSRSVALSPESHWLSLCTDGQEFDRVPGGQVAAFLEQAELE